MFKCFLKYLFLYGAMIILKQVICNIYRHLLMITKCKCIIILVEWMFIVCFRKAEKLYSSVFNLCKMNARNKCYEYFLT
jgi:hypothetical protein